MKGLGSSPRYWCNRRLPREQEEAFRLAIEQLPQVRPGGHIRGEDIRQLLAQQFDVAYSLNDVCELLKRLGIVYISARSRSPHADPVSQADFEKCLLREVQAGLPAEVKPSQVDIWFKDEMRIGQRGTQTRLWAPKGTRPRVVRQQTSVSAYTFGAIGAEHDTAVGLVLPHADTQTMAHHLRAISAVVPEGRHAEAFVNRAGWHTTTKLPRLPNLTLLPLPTGSPEPNPTEQV